MLSYKKWMSLKESFGGTFSLGIGQQNVLGGVIGATGVDHDAVEAEEAELEEAKKCAKKKMCKGGKKKMGAGMGDELVKPAAPKDDDDMDMDDDDVSDDDMDSDDDDMDDSDGGGDDDVDLDGDGDDDSDDMGDEKPMMKKPMTPMMSKKKSKKNAKKNSKKKMTKEDFDFWNSLKNQLGTSPNQKYSDGFTTYEEDSLINPEASNDDEPAAGDVGFAPQQKLGQIPSYTEWLKENFKN